MWTDFQNSFTKLHKIDIKFRLNILIVTSNVKIR